MRRRRSGVGGLLLAVAPMALWAGQNPAASPPPPPAPAMGDRVAPFSAEGLDGLVAQVSYPKGSKTILLFFLSGCPTCHKMIPLWNDAHARRPRHLRVVGILMDREPPGFFVAMPVAFPVLRAPSRDFLRAYKINRVPVTLRVGEGGIVEDVGVGQLDGIRLGELFRP